MPFSDAFHALPVFFCKISISRLCHYLVPKYIISAKKAEKQSFPLLKAIKISICQIIAKKLILVKTLTKHFGQSIHIQPKKFWLLFFFIKRHNIIENGKILRTHLLQLPDSYRQSLLSCLYTYISFHASLTFISSKSTSKKVCINQTCS